MGVNSDGTREFPERNSVLPRRPNSPSLNGSRAMTHKTTRREFVQRSAAVAAGVGPTWWFDTNLGVAADKETAKVERLNFACIGVGGKGSSDSADAGRNGDVVAICDIDDKNLDRAATAFPNAKKFNDFRKMLEEMGHEHRRGDGQHARSHARPRPRRWPCEWASIALLPEATDAHVYEARADARTRRREQGGDADGQPGHRRRRPARSGRD